MKLNVKFEETTNCFPVTLIDNNETFEIKFSELQILDGDRTPYYDEDYMLFPKFESQELETAEKKMRANVLLFPISVMSVSNPQGGNTVIIGG